MPGAPSLFVVSHADGTIIMYDKDREDEHFTPRDPNQRSQTQSYSATGTSDSSSPSESSAGGEWDPLESIFVTTPKWHPSTAHANHNIHNRARSDKDRVAKNPVGHWRVSKRGIVGEYDASHL